MKDYIHLFRQICFFLLLGQSAHAAFIERTYLMIQENHPLHKGSSINDTNHLDETPLHLAIKHNDLKTAEQCIVMGANVNASPNEAGPPLHFVKSIEAAQLLLDNGAELNQLNYQHENELSHAISQQNVELVKFFLENGSLVNLGLLHNGQGIIYSIWKACDDAWLGFLDATEHLWKRYDIRVGRQVVWSATKFESYVHRMDDGDPRKTFYRVWACCMQRAISDLQRIGQCFDTPEKPDKTPLVQAVIQGHEDIARLLLEHGADVHAQGRKRDGSALCYLLSSNRSEEEDWAMFETLTEYGAHQAPFQLNWANNHAGLNSTVCSFRELAKERGKHELFSLLHKKSKKVKNSSSFNRRPISLAHRNLFFLAPK